MTKGPWDNLVPPIQSVVPANRAEPPAVTEDDDKDDSGYSSVATSSTSQSVIQRRRTEKADITMPALYTAELVRQEIEADLARYPSLDPPTQRHIANKFLALHQRVQEEGFYECRMSEYGKELLRYAFLFAGFATALHYGWYILSACCLGLFWQQIMFTAHDAGHRGITQDITADTLIGILIGNFCCGLSIGWWKSSHNVHHLVTNSPVGATPDCSALRMAN